MIQSTGKMPDMNKSSAAMIGYVMIIPNDYQTFIVAHPHWFAYLCLLVFVTFIIYNSIFIKDKDQKQIKSKKG